MTVRHVESRLKRHLVDVTAVAPDAAPMLHSNDCFLSLQPAASTLSLQDMMPSMIPVIVDPLPDLKGSNQDSMKHNMHRIMHNM